MRVRRFLLDTIASRTLLVLLVGFSVSHLASNVLYETAGHDSASAHFFLSFAIMIVGVAVLSVWAVLRLTAPIRTFAQAAERLGRNVDAPPLPEDGPREIRLASRTFNEMQWRLRRFVDDRTRMLAAISHDLRTPITRLRLRAEFLEDPEQQAKMMADLDEMEAMISATLAFAKDDTAHTPHEVVNLAALIESICDDCADIGRDVVYTGPDRMPCDCSPLALRRALTNLVENAVKYGGRARVSLHADAERVVIDVDDDGPGVPENELERVFEPFYRLEASRSRESGGAGLGLAIARSAIRTHGGDLTLGNRTGSGLRAEVTPPRTIAGHESEDAC